MRRVAEALGATVLALALGAAPGAPARGADALGDARLFFAPHERAAATASGPVPGASADPARGADDAGASAPGGPGSGPSVPRAASADTTRRDGPPRFEALVGVAGRVRIVVDGRVCRGERGRTALRCGRLPDGVGALALGADGRRLLVTFADGARRHVAVGERLRP